MLRLGLGLFSHHFLDFPPWAGVVDGDLANLEPVLDNVCDLALGKDHEYCAERVY